VILGRKKGRWRLASPSRRRKDRIARPVQCRPRTSRQGVRRGGVSVGVDRERAYIDEPLQALLPNGASRRSSGHHGVSRSNRGMSSHPGGQMIDDRYPRCPEAVLRGEEIGRPALERSAPTLFGRTASDCEAVVDLVWASDTRNHAATSTYNSRPMNPFAPVTSIVASAG